MDHDLPQRLKQGTRELHTKAERSGVMAALLRGRIGRDAYCALLSNLHAIYTALEAALDVPEVSGRLGSLWHPAFRRADVIAQDLHTLHGSGWNDAFGLEPAAARYGERLRELQCRSDARLAAHVYTRCLGDLHGGQLLGRIVREQYGLEGEDGTRFYDFGEPVRVDALRAALRAALAGLPVDAQEAEAIVAEARWSFVTHRELFDELQARYP